MKEYLENRISYLKKEDAEACEKRWSKYSSQVEKALARELSNELTARRIELEDALNHLKNL